jgi:hypothetical protein
LSKRCELVVMNFEYSCVFNRPAYLVLPEVLSKPVVCAGNWGLPATGKF